MPDNTLIPNTYQKPNVYSDLYDYYLSPEESKVLDFIIRRILGFEEHRATRRDRISLSQVCEGIQRADGTWITRGTGLSRPTASKCVKSLARFRFIAEIGEATQDGQEYELNTGQLGDIRLDLLEQRKADEQARQNKRGQAIQAAKHMRFTSKSDLPPAEGSKSDLPQVVNAIYQGSKSDLPQVVNAIYTQNPHQNPPSKPTRNPGGTAASAAPPPPSESVPFEAIPPAPSEARNPTPQQALVGAWGAVMELDINIPANAKRVGNMLAGLRKSKDCPPTPDIATWRFGRTPPPDGSWNFYTHTWQGGKGQPPTEREINAYWGAWLRPPLAVVSGNGQPRAAPPQEDGIAALRARLTEQTPTNGSVIEGRFKHG